ncbi:hypothetical protein J3D47_003479 [Pseudomonas laurylsulfativorans]|uniref:DUF1254 domain-containing protein n=1 Tax=Pseudomonas laurylsulfativorans TaxID=1943631 RepID=UPI00209FDE0F|nr:DUF1214 domain-containing protein [Pseudomonas laurylsulfativorans]MCP1419236.1 hypothetical protein [Pseudomonas laurylsulfativorans]
MNKLSPPPFVRMTLTALAVSGLLLALPASANETVAPAGPVANTVMTPGYARAVAQMAYAWGWPLVNLQTRRMMYEQVPTIGLLGPTPVAPVNQLAMLSDYIDPDIRIVAHPNQDVVYGFGALALDKAPVILQVPDFGERFWMFELADQRTDSFARVAKIYGTQPGFYLIVGPEWKGEKPAGVEAVLRSPTNTGVVIPRVFMADTAQDREAVQPLLNQIAMYPLSTFDGKIKTIDWKHLPRLPLPKAATDKPAGETQWVTPERFFAQLKRVLAEVPPLPGEESLYAQFRALIAAGEADPAIAKVLQDSAQQSEKDIVDPLFYLSRNGVRIANGWNRPFNNAAFGTDYLTRLAIAKSNIFENHARETTYLFREEDGDGQRLSGERSYTLTFPAGQTPPVSGFWSLTLYDPLHFFAANEINRYSTGTKNKDLKYNADGSLTLYIQHQRPTEDKVGNWLPAPRGEFALTLRAYGPSDALIKGDWAPPPLVPGPQHN